MQRARRFPRWFPAVNCRRISLKRQFTYAAEIIVVANICNLLERAFTYYFSGIGLGGCTFAECLG